MKEKNRNSWTRLLLPALTAAFISLATHDPHRVENMYSNGVFPFLARIQRSVFGVFPFSIGDLAYLSTICLLLWYLIKFLKTCISRENKKALFLKVLRSIVLFGLWTYCIFYILWGLNYYRSGVVSVFSLKKTEVTQKEIFFLTNLLKDSVNACVALKKQTAPIPHVITSYESGAAAAYQHLRKHFPFIHYEKKSFKASLFGEFFNYMGVQGYYNPFTGESQINLQAPAFLIPFVSCHEIAHQLGFASESEANFVGFLAAKHSAEPHVRYSGYLNMFIYAANQLKRTDSLALKKIAAELHQDVRADIRSYYAYLDKYQSSLQDGSGLLYDFYLRQNSQKNGILTYGEVTQWLLAYRKTYGEL